MPRVAVVTGANKGIGYFIVKLLCRSQTQDVVYLTARDEGRGRAAVEALKQEGCQAAFHPLDIDSPASIDQFAAYLKGKYGGLDVLVNNAAIAYKGASTAPFDEQAEVTNKTNYFGTLNVCNALIPLIREGGRVVHVGSRGGHMAFANMAAPLQERFDSAQLTVEELSKLISSFIAATKAGDHQRKGWPNSAYGVSKAGITALCAIQQREYDAAHPGNDVIFSVCCPGYCATDMSSHKGPRPAEEGADVAFFLATLPARSTVSRGAFWGERNLVPWSRDWRWR